MALAASVCSSPQQPQVVAAPASAAKLAESRGVARRKAAQPTALPVAERLLASQPLAGVAGLSRFREKLGKLGSEANSTVVVAHWGDSHAATDQFSGELRRRLQQRFGDAGPGFVLLGQPWPSYRHDALKLGARGRWRAERLRSRYSRRRPRPRDDWLGVAGVSVSSRGSARATIEVKRGRVDSLALFFLRQPRGGRIDLRSGGKLRRRLLTMASRKQLAFARIDFPRAVRRMILSARGGEVRLLGADLRRDQPGVRYHTFGINGATAESVLSWNAEVLEEQLTQLAPDLIVIAYGSNELDRQTLTAQSFSKTFSEVIRRFRTAAGQTADCLVLGAPDQARHKRETGWAVPESLSWIIAVQRRVAAEAGCAFWDQQAAMGGKAAIFGWAAVRPPLARPDHIHLYGRGYRALAGALFKQLVGAGAGDRAKAGELSRSGE